MVQAVKPNAVTVTMKKAVTRSMEHAQTDVLPVGEETLATKVYCSIAKLLVINVRMQKIYNKENMINISL